MTNDQWKVRGSQDRRRLSASSSSNLSNWRVIFMTIFCSVRIIRALDRAFPASIAHSHPNDYFNIIKTKWRIEKDRRRRRRRRRICPFILSIWRLRWWRRRWWKNSQSSSSSSSSYCQGNTKLLCMAVVSFSFSFSCCCCCCCCYSLSLSAAAYIHRLLLAMRARARVCNLQLFSLFSAAAAAAAAVVAVYKIAGTRDFKGNEGRKEGEREIWRWWWWWW